MLSFTLNYTATEVTHETDFLSGADVLAIERGVPRFRWNAAINQRVGRVGLLGRLSYYGPWIDYYYTRLWVDAAARRSRTTRPSSTSRPPSPSRPT